MARFKVPANPPTTQKTIRFSNDIVDAVESEIRGTDCTFSAFVIEATRVALEDLKEQREEGK